MEDNLGMGTNTITSATDNNVDANVIDNIMGGEDNLQQQLPTEDDKINSNELDTFLASLESASTQVGGIDFGELAEAFDLETPEGRAEIQKEINDLRERGFTDEQIIHSAQTAVEAFESGYQQALDEIEGKTLNPQQVKEQLIQNLTKDELRNLRPLSNWVREVAGDILQDQETFQAIFSDATAIKVLNRLFNASIGSNNVRELPAKPRNVVQIDPSQAMGQYIEWLNSQPSVSRDQTIQKIGELRQQIKSDDMPIFDELFKVLM